MANEITASVSMTFAKGTLGSHQLSSGNFNVTVSGDAYIRNVQTVGEAAREVLLLGDVTTPGFAILHNCDSANYVEVWGNGTDTSAVLKIEAGKWNLVSFGSTTPNVKANTAPVRLECYIVAT